MQFNNKINVPFSSKAFVSGVLAFFLDMTLPPKDETTKKDRGMIWWKRFRSFKSDNRSEEFYSLPFNLSNYFPSHWLITLYTSTSNYFTILLCFCKLMKKLSSSGHVPFNSSISCNMYNRWSMMSYSYFLFTRMIDMEKLAQSPKSKNNDLCCK